MPTFIRYVFLIVSLLGFSTAFASDEGKDCFSLMDNENYKEALLQCTTLAKQGQAKAQFNVGLLYDDGLGVTQDYKQAAHWYTKAAIKS